MVVVVSVGVVVVLVVNVLEPQLLRQQLAFVRVRVHRHHLLAELHLVRVHVGLGQEVGAVHEGVRVAVVRVKGRVRRMMVSWRVGE